MIYRGTPAAGNGWHAKTQYEIGHKFEAKLGHPIFPGSFNLALEKPPKFLEWGDPLCTVSGKVRGLDRWYSLYNAVIIGYNIKVYALRYQGAWRVPALELLSQERLRDHFGEDEVLEVEVTGV